MWSLEEVVERGVALSRLLRLVLPLLVLRTTPFVGYVLGARAFGPVEKLVAASAYGGLLAVAYWAGFPPAALLEIALPTYGFGRAAAFAVWLLAGVHARGHLPTPLVFAACAALGLFLPDLVLPPAVRATAALVGWEFMLAAHSYCVERKRGRASRSIGECFFFLIVNPTLVFTDRGERIGAPKFSTKACLRALMGVSVLWVFFMLRAGAAAGIGTGTALAPVVLVLTLSLAEYAGHSGRASVEIGLMRLLGWQVPERYRYPFLARSPADFWRRWNYYVSAWAKRYVFVPVALNLGRHVRGAPRFAVVGVGVLSAFVAIGALHDLANLQRGAGLAGGVAAVFFANGVVLLLWEAARRMTCGLRKRSLGRIVVNDGTIAIGGDVAIRAAMATASWAACVVFLLLMGAVAIPVFSGNTQVIQQFLSWLSI